MHTSWMILTGRNCDIEATRKGLELHVTSLEPNDTPDLPPEVGRLCNKEVQNLSIASGGKYRYLRHGAQRHASAGAIPSWGCPRQQFALRDVQRGGHSHA